MTIERTPEMMRAARDALHAGGNLSDVIKAVLALIERDYVPRWGTMTIPLGVDYGELLAQPSFMQYVRDAAEERAKYMGGTIEFEKYEIVQSFPGTYSISWKLRRND